MNGQAMTLVEIFIAPQQVAWLNDCVMVFAKGEAVPMAERVLHRVRGVTNYRVFGRPGLPGNPAEHTEEGLLRIRVIGELRSPQARMPELERQLTAEG